MGYFRRLVRIFATIFAISFLLISVVAKGPMTAPGTPCPSQNLLSLNFDTGEMPTQCVCKEEAAKQAQLDSSAHVHCIVPQELRLKTYARIEADSVVSRLEERFDSSDAKVPLVPPPNAG